MQDLRTAAWPVPYSGKLRPDSLGKDRGLGEPANRKEFGKRPRPPLQCHGQMPEQVAGLYYYYYYNIFKTLGTYNPEGD